MPHYIFRQGAIYQYPRRSTDRKDPYRQRTVLGPDVGQARVFNTKGAAKNSSNGWGEVVEVELKERETMEAKSDLIFYFKHDDDPYSEYGIRVASRHEDGDKRAEELADNLRPFLKEGVTLKTWSMPSRFARRTV